MMIFLRLCLVFLSISKQTWKLQSELVNFNGSLLRSLSLYIRIQGEDNESVIYNPDTAQWRMELVFRK